AYRADDAASCRAERVGPSSWAAQTKAGPAVRPAPWGGLRETRSGFRAEQGVVGRGAEREAVWGLGVG
ncbi:MAG: hypothetical protein ACK58T_49155, partial [Phycisphaerae bacterium]